MNCNFRCIYCFEKDNYFNVTLNEDIENAIVDYISSQMHIISHLFITWYGGEPLLEIDKLLRMNTKIKDLCNINKVTYTSSIVTNGYFLEENNINKLIRMKVNDIQITLDGTEDIHNRRRPLINGSGTFSKIVSNIKKINGRIPVFIRINTDLDNMHNVYDVVALFKKEIKNLTFYLGHVAPSNDKYEISKCMLVNEFSKFNLDFMIDNNVPISNIYPYPKMNYCGADKINGLVIDPNGDVYKCWSDIGIADRRVGNIKDNDKIENQQLYCDYLLYDPTTDKNCSKCNVLPLCLGGCPHRRITQIEVCESIKYNLENYIKEYSKTLLGGN